MIRGVRYRFDEHGEKNAVRIDLKRGRGSGKISWT